MDAHLKAFLERFGAATTVVDASAAQIERYRGKLPDKLLEYWREIGFSGFMNGLIWIVDPAEYEDDMDAWLGETKIVERDAYHVIARSGFGDLYLWGEKTGHKYVIHSARAWVIEKDGDENEIAKSGPERPLKRFMAVQTPSYADILDTNKNPLFAQAVAKFGGLAHDEVFAFEPSLILGGTPMLNAVAKRNVHIHLFLLSQLGQLEILDKQALARGSFM